MDTCSASVLGAFERSASKRNLRSRNSPAVVWCIVDASVGLPWYLHVELRTLFALAPGNSQSSVRRQGISAEVFLERSSWRGARVDGSCTPRTQLMLQCCRHRHPVDCSSFTQSGEVHTVDTSVGSRAGSHGNLDTTFTSLAPGSHLLAVFALLLRSSLPCVRHSSGGVAGSFDSQVTCRQ